MAVCEASDSAPSSSGVSSIPTDATLKQTCDDILQEYQPYNVSLLSSISSVECYVDPRSFFILYEIYNLNVDNTFEFEIHTHIIIYRKLYKNLFSIIDFAPSANIIKNYELYDNLDKTSHYPNKFSN